MQLIKSSHKSSHDTAVKKRVGRIISIEIFLSSNLKKEECTNSMYKCTKLGENKKDTRKLTALQC